MTFEGIIRKINHMHHSDFVHLHTHTEYSLLDGANQIDDLVELAQKYKMPAMAITDHGNMFGAVEFYQKALKGGIKPIIGCEVYVAPASRLEKNVNGFKNASYHLILLAADETGYKNLLKLITSAHLEGFYYRPRIDKEILAQHSKGLIGLSSCLKGEIPYKINKGDTEGAKKALGEYIDILGKENFYLEIMDNRLEEQYKVNKELINLSKEFDIPVVATNDCHYLKKEDAKAHDILLCIQTGKTVNDTERLRFSTDDFYFKSPEEMHKAFKDIPEALLNTKIIAERCNLNLKLNELHLPNYHVPEGYTREDYLSELAKKGLEERLKQIDTKIPSDFYKTRLERELKTINSMGYAGYFLIVWDIINYAKNKGIPVGPGRGSAAGSLAAYSLKITDIDPLRYGLLFERFLNPDRISMPDIDMDFCMDRREEVIHYVTNKFGTDHVAQIITFGTMAAKGVIRDVGRVLDIPYIEVDKVAKLVPNTLNITIDEAIKAEPRLKELIENDQKINELIKIAKNLEGLARHASTHAAGIVISQEPLTEYTPLYKGDKDEIITQYNMKLIEKVGLIKFDFLGLKTLTLIDNAVQLINKKAEAQNSEPLPFSIETIPLNDQKTYDLLSSGKTFGVFQLESSGMREILIRLKPETFEDIIALVALYRPGPLGSGMVDDFIKRKKGLTAIKYELPELEPILKETYGVILYQEQVMKIANVLSGFSLAEADILRRAMGKKIPEEMEKMKKTFIEGAHKNKINEKKAEKIFELIEYFAGYGFNKSHSAAYALIAYQTAYLKANYPVEFMASLLTSEMGNTDKIVRYIRECKSMGIKILPPDVNESSKQFTIVEEGIRFGLAAIKNVGEAAIEAIISARESSGRFALIFDFCKKVDLRKVNKKVIESLIKCGAFDSTNMKRSQLMAVYEKAAEKANQIKKESALNQINIFGNLQKEDDASAESIPDLPEWEEGVRLKSEKDTLGFYITGHPLSNYEAELKRFETFTSEALAELPDEKEVNICGIITEIKNTTTKRGDKMAYLRIEDLYGTVDVIVFPDTYRSSNHLFNTDTPLLISGNIDKGEKGIKLKATKITTISNAKNKQLSKVNIKVDSAALSQNELRQLKDILLKYRGNCSVYISMTIPNHGESVIAVNNDIRVDPTRSLITEIENFLGKDTVTFN